jgi:hypothetical protein
MKTSTSAQLQQLCPSSVVQEVYRPGYEVELDFTNNITEQECFLERNEGQLLATEVITFIYQNTLLPAANFVSIHTFDKQVKYQISIVLEHSRWQGKLSLHRFVPKLLRTCENKHINLVLEQEDDYSFYLLMTLEVAPEQRIKDRLIASSLTLLDLINRLNL